MIRRRGARRAIARAPERARRGAALDYVLVLGVIIPLVAIVMPLGTRMLQLVYEMLLVFVSWPFL